MKTIEAVLVDSTVTVNGSYIFRSGPGAEVTLVWNVTGAVTGTTPIITFSLEEVDPADELTPLDVSVSSGAIRTAGAGTVSVSTTNSPVVRVSWVLGGTTPSFAGVYATVFRKDSLSSTHALVTTGYAPDPASVVTTARDVRADPSGQLSVRGNSFTDEGSFRDDFGGTSLFTSLTGAVTFTNGSMTVVGDGSAFTTELTTDHHVRLAAHSNAALARIKSVDSDNQLTLVSSYSGATATGVAVSSNWLVDIAASPANLTVTGSIVSLSNSTVSGAVVSLSRKSDYLPCQMTASVTVSQRIPNQNVVIGYEDNPQAPKCFAVFLLDGSSATTVKCRSGFDVDSIQETVVTLVSRTVFTINGTKVATHQTHVPAPYADLFQVIYIQNTNTTSSITTVSVDSVLFYNYDSLDIAPPMQIEGYPGGQPITIQFGSAGGGLALPKLINLYFNKTEGAIIANVYKRIATYTVPPSYNGYLIKYVSYQNETASSRVVAETALGYHDSNTNVFTAGAAYAPPQWAAVVQAEVTTAFASGSGSVVLTVTYTNEIGTTGRTGTISVPKGSAIASRWDLVLQGADLGVMSVQNCSRSVAQVGVVKFLGLLHLALHQDQSTTAQTETLFAPGAITFPSGTVLGVEYAGGTVAKTRIFDTLVQLVQ
jgi:hypothetical protein